MSVILSLPYPVSTNRYYRTTVSGGRSMTFRSDEAMAYKEKVGWIARAAGVRQPSTDPMILLLIIKPVLPKDHEARARKLGPNWHLQVRCIDLDNCLKVSIDTMQGLLYENDKQIVDLRIRRGEPVADGALIVCSSIYISDNQGRGHV